MYDIKLLYAEDEEDLRVVYTEIFKRSFKYLYVAKDGEEALELYRSFKPDIIISDITMPKLNGIDLIKHIRNDDQETQIILLTAHDSKDYLLKAIPLNLYDYLIKPIDTRALNKLLNKCIEKLKYQKSKQIQINDHYSYSMETKELCEDGVHIKLSKNEVKLIELFIGNLQKVYTTEELFDFVWDDYEYSMSKLRSLINRFNGKLQYKLIESIYGVGYKISNLS